MLNLARHRFSRSVQLKPRNSTPVYQEQGLAVSTRMGLQRSAVTLPVLSTLRTSPCASQVLNCRAGEVLCAIQ